MTKTPDDNQFMSDADPQGGYPDDGFGDAGAGDSSPLYAEDDVWAGDAGDAPVTELPADDFSDMPEEPAPAAKKSALKADAGKPPASAMAGGSKNMIFYGVIGLGVLFAGGMAFLQFSGQDTANYAIDPESAAAAPIDTAQPAAQADVVSSLGGGAAPAGPQDIPGLEDALRSGSEDVAESWTQSTIPAADTISPEAPVVSPDVIAAEMPKSTLVADAASAAAMMGGGTDAPPVADNTLATPQAPSVNPAAAAVLGAEASAPVTPEPAAPDMAAVPGLLEPAGAGKPALDNVAAAGPASEDSGRMVKLEEQMKGLEQAVVNMAAQLQQLQGRDASSREAVELKDLQALRAQVSSLRSDLDRLTRAGGAAPRTVERETAKETPRVTRKVAAREAPKASPAEKPAESAAGSNWILRAATPDAAWIAPAGSPNAIRSVAVGERIEGLGRVRAIRNEGGAWVVETTGGVLR